MPHLISKTILIVAELFNYTNNKTETRTYNFKKITSKKKAPEAMT